MMKLLRKHRTWLMIVIAILSIPFIFYFVKSDLSQIRSDDFGRIYDHKITVIEARKYARLLWLARTFALPELSQELTLGAKDDNQAYPQFIFNLIVLRHEAERLGIRPTEDEVVEMVHNISAFQGSSGFDLKKYDDFIHDGLSPRGMDEGQIAELMRDELSLKRIKRLLATGVSVSESVGKTNFDEAYGKLNVSVIRLHGADLAKEVNITDDNARKYFDEHKTEFKTEEKRKVDFVELALTDEQKKLTGKQRIDPLQKLADRANDVSQSLLEKGADFKQVAAKYQLPVKTTGEFTSAAPDPQLKAADPQLAAMAFKLTPQEPNSDPVQVADGFYILHLDGTVPSRPLTLEEAKPKVVETLKRSRSQGLVATKAARTVGELREWIKSGHALEAAAQKAGVKPEKLAPFSLVDENEAKPTDKPDLFMIKNAAAQLKSGEVSDFIPWEDGGLIVVLEKREPPDAAKYAQQKAAFDQRYLKNKQEIVFYEWLQDRQREAGLVPASGGKG